MLVTFTVAPGNTAPVRSVTVPSTVARTAWAAASPAMIEHTTAARTTARYRVTVLFSSETFVRVAPLCVNARAVAKSFVEIRAISENDAGRAVARRSAGCVLAPSWNAEAAATYRRGSGVASLRRGGGHCRRDTLHQRAEPQLCGITLESRLPHHGFV